MNIIGKNIKRLRQSEGLTQGQVAKQLGISIPAYSKIETGITDINFSRMNQIAAFFKVDITTLIFEEDKRDKNPFEAQYFETLNSLTESQGEVSKLKSQVIRLYEQLELRP